MWWRITEDTVVPNWMSELKSLGEGHPWVMTRPTESERWVGSAGRRR